MFANASTGESLRPTPSSRTCCSSRSHRNRGGGPAAATVHRCEPTAAARSCTSLRRSTSAPCTCAAISRSDPPAGSSPTLAELQQSCCARKPLTEHDAVLRFAAELVDQRVWLYAARWPSPPTTESSTAVRQQHCLLR